MGIFSKIKKAVKKGLAKLGKILNSKWGKILMAAITVVTAGAALAAGAAAFSSQAAGASFMTKFVAGAKSFVGALLNPVKAVKGMAGNIKTVAGAVKGGTAAANAAAQAGQAASAVGSTVANTPEALAAGTSAAGASAATTAVPAGSQVVNGVTKVAPAAQQGLLSRAASGTMDFLKSAGGGTLASGAIKGYAEGAAQEEMFDKQQQREDAQNAQWTDPSKMVGLNAAVKRDIGVPSGYLARARRVSQFLNNRDYAYPTTPTDADTVADYALPGGQ